MSELTADDLWPLVLKLPLAERLQLARKALASGLRQDGDAAASYRAVPPTTAEFGSDNDQLAWDAAGWEEFDASR